MLIALQISVGTVLLFLASCTSPNPREASAKQLFREINEIEQSQIGGRPKEEVMQALSRLNEAKKSFPEARDQIMADAQIGREFFTAGIADNDLIISKYEELLSLGLSKSNEDCIEVSIKVQHAYTERMKHALSQIELYFDESIVNKETFDLKNSLIKEEGDLVDKKLNELKEEQKPCVQNRLWGLNRWIAT